MSRTILLIALVCSTASRAIAQTCSNGMGGDLIVAVATTIDTDTGVITPPGAISAGFDGSAFHFVNIDIQIAGTLTATGSQPLILLATTDTTVAGLIDVSGAPGGDVQLICNEPGAAGGVAGPGGFDGGAGGGLAPGSGANDGDAGGGPGGGGGGMDLDSGNGSGGCGGGGGHATAGTAGGSRGNGVGGAGGLTYASLPPLTGGSGGGGASTDDDTAPVGPPVGPGDDGGAGGGGGGGAVRIYSGTLAVTGTIDASGGPGGNGNTCNFSGPGGGGAGGAIELVGAVLPVVMGTLNVDGGAGGTHASGPELGGTGGVGRTTVAQFSCVPGPTCTIMGAGGVLSGDVSFDIDASSPNSPTVDITFEFSLDGGTTWTVCTPAAGSALANPALATPTGMSTFLWDTSADSVGTAMLAMGVLVQAVVVDGVAIAQGLCTTLPFDVDNSMLCTGFCGDCNLSGASPDILDALSAAQIAAGLIVPTLEQEACCDVDTSGMVTVLDSLQIAQAAAALPVMLVCM